MNSSWSENNAITCQILDDNMILILKSYYIFPQNVLLVSLYLDFRIVPWLQHVWIGSQLVKAH